MNLGPISLRPSRLALGLAALLAAWSAAADESAGAARVAARAAARAHVRLDPAQAAMIAEEQKSDRPTRKADLGNKIFHDTTLSEPQGQSCASCHRANLGFTDKGSTSHGANPALFGPRNAPTITYAMFTPPLYAGGDEGPLAYTGGQFRDGRVNFLSDQAKVPLMNPIEMGNPDVPSLIAKVAAAPYAAEFQAAYGAGIFNDPDAAFTALADALQRFESSPLFSRFDSKFDAYRRGETTLTDAEARGLAVFNDPDKGNCALCHLTGPDPVFGARPLLTDFGFDNIGVPRNPDNKFYTMPAQYNPDGKHYVDPGLGAIVPRPTQVGQFKSPSLRNVAVTGPYTHNGYFKTLRGLVDFYNTRDVKPRCSSPFTREADAIAQGCWPVAEQPATVNKTDLGNLHLSDQDVDDIVAFLGTLTDGWKPSGDKKH